MYEPDEERGHVPKLGARRNPPPEGGVESLNANGRSSTLDRDDDHYLPGLTTLAH
jgi:hypothetical protein